MRYVYTPCAGRIKRDGLLKNLRRCVVNGFIRPVSEGRGRIIPGARPQEIHCSGYHHAFLPDWGYKGGAIHG